jgi:hypothetical protein
MAYLLKGSFSTEAYTVNLPPQITPFIGREKELGKLSGLLSDRNVRLVTIVGPALVMVISPFFPATGVFLISATMLTVITCMAFLLTRPPQVEPG